MFLPMTEKEMKKRGWKELDVILITGDAYVDHPSFGISIIGRVLENAGFKVGIISQPDWRKEDALLELGKPNLFFGISAGNVDSMVSNYTASGKKRKTDVYSPKYGTIKRPDRATIVYSNYVKSVYKDTKIILGGIEASLRRFAHYDWWQNKIRKSILLDSKADLICYGMSEKSILKVAVEIRRTGEVPRNVPGTLFWDSKKPEEGTELPSYETILREKEKYLTFFDVFYKGTDPFVKKRLFQKQDNRYVVQNPPELYSTEDLDSIYSIEFEKKVHPDCLKYGEVKAFETVKNSITTHRGCYGECNFCSIGLHQGRYVVSRSKENIMDEVETLTKKSYFRGTVSDLGGPTANMYGYECSKKFDTGACKEKKCLFPNVCKNLPVNHSKYLDLLESVNRIKGVNNVFIGSGLRYDLILKDANAGNVLKKILKKHISGKMKIAPEHVNRTVLALMSKPEEEILLDFIRLFRMVRNRNQFLACYFIAAHPGSDLNTMNELRDFIKKYLEIPQNQIQIFTPSPSTYSTAMYYVERDMKGKDIFVEKSFKGREKQKNVLINKKENH